MTDGARLFADLVFVEVRLFDLVEERLRDELDQPATNLLCLDVIDTVESCRVQDMSRHLGISVGGASKAVDRLERDGLCRRTAHPDDRRSSTIALTARGQRVLRRARELAAETIASAPGMTAARSSVLSRELAALRTPLTSP